MRMLFISIHAPLAGCDRRGNIPSPHFFISIHAPLAGCDRRGGQSPEERRNFNPRTPCGVRPAYPWGCDRAQTHFNPRTPCGVRRRRAGGKASSIVISIHAPLAGCDCQARLCRTEGKKFQSTHPLRGATGAQAQSLYRPGNFNPRTPCGVRQGIHTPHDTDFPISIHAPLAGCDNSADVRFFGNGYFNPRTPCGVRLSRQFSTPRRN